jgi:hypothetical protein
MLTMRKATADQGKAIVVPLDASRTHCKMMGEDWNQNSALGMAHAFN